MSTDAEDRRKAELIDALRARDVAEREAWQQLFASVRDELQHPSRLLDSTYAHQVYDPDGELCYTPDGTPPV